MLSVFTQHVWGKAKVPHSRCRLAGLLIKLSMQVTMTVDRRWTPKLAFGFDPALRVASRSNGGSKVCGCRSGAGEGSELLERRKSTGFASEVPAIMR